MTIFKDLLILYNFLLYNLFSIINQFFIIHSITVFYYSFNILFRCVEIGYKKQNEFLCSRIFDFGFNYFEKKYLTFLNKLGNILIVNEV